MPDSDDRSLIVVPAVVALMSKIPELPMDTREESLIDPEPDNASVPEEIVVTPEYVLVFERVKAGPEIVIPPDP